MISFLKMWEIFTTKWDVFARGALVSVQLAFYTVVFGTLLGMIIALLRTVKFAPIRWIFNAYVELLRGTPMLIQLLIIYFGVGQLGFKLGRMNAGILTLAINSSAYMAEIFRAGIQSIDRGQTEAARSLGMGRAKTMLYIVLPQALRTTLPAIGNEFVVIIKESSILYTIGIYELTYQANKLASTNYLYIETLLISALIYFVLTFTTSRLLAILERRMSRGEYQA